MKVLGLSGVSIVPQHCWISCHFFFLYFFFVFFFCFWGKGSSVQGMLFLLEAQRAAMRVIVTKKLSFLVIARRGHFGWLVDPAHLEANSLPRAEFQRIDTPNSVPIDELLPL
jgi:hypothetical protein